MSRSRAVSLISAALPLAFASGNLFFHPVLDDPAAPPDAGAESLRGLVTKRGEVYDKMRGIIDASTAAGTMTPEQRTEYDALEKRYDEQSELIERHNRANERAAAALRTQTKTGDAGGSPGGSDVRVLGARDRDLPVQDRQAYRDAFMDLCIRGEAGCKPESLRVMTEGTDAEGGYLAPTVFYSALQKAIEQESVVRKLARKIPLGAFKTNITIEDDIADAEVQAGTWAAESGALAESTPGVSQVQMIPRRLGRLIKVSRELLEDASARGPDFNPETIIRERFARMFAHAEEYGLCLGTSAANMPVGIFTYTGTPGTITVGKTTASNSAFTGVELKQWIYSLPQKYRLMPGTAIVVNDSTLGMLATLGQPGAGSDGFLWQPSYKDGEPDRINGIPVFASPWAPAFAANTIFGVIGNFNYYLLGERNTMTMQVLRELYAVNHQTGFIATKRLDAKVTRVDAFRYIKAAA